MEMRLITDDSKYTSKANPKYSATLTAPNNVNFSTFGDLGKVTFVSQDVGTAVLNRKLTRY